MASLEKRPLQAPRRICALKIDRIWHEIWCYESEEKANSGMEIGKLAKALSERHPALLEDAWATEIRIACQNGLLTFGEVSSEDGPTLTIVGRPNSELPEEEKGDRDWFCFKCHKHGDVVRCRNCTKAFHLECLPNNWATILFGVMPVMAVMERVCPSCEMIYKKPSMAKIRDTKMLNELLVFLIDGIKAWEIPFLNSAVGVDWVRAINCTDSEAWRFSYQVYSPIGVTFIHNKALQGGYLSLEEFQVDCETLAHNLGVFFGVEILQERRIGWQFLNTVLRDIEEIKLCHDCFYHSNKKEGDWWFCQPCSVPHELVWTKTHGYPAWPAKVLKKFDGKWEVRYFGDPHQRSVLPDKDVKPITASVKKSRQTKALKQAITELEMFQQLQN